ncbi:MAG: macro domain-containing protein [Firmicutes bacterium]|nr:macro domain-containing protein [Bacillota bacterium]
MPFQIVHNDITKMHTDAIVNAANSRLQVGGGVCGAIFAAAGDRKLQEECNRKSPCPTGSAVITGGYGLPAKYIVHAVGPIWQGGSQGEETLLRSAYLTSLKLAAEKGCRSISFPLISAGIYGYPKEQALQVAVSAFSRFLMEQDDGEEMDIYLVVFDRSAVSLSEKLFQEIRHYIDTFHDEEEKERRRRFEYEICCASICEDADVLRERSLEELVNNLEETFSEMVLRLVDEKGYKDSQVYKRANLDRKLFSKIRSNPDYHPKKETVLALAVGLQLSVDETLDLLQRAGYTLSNSSRTDVIVRFFLEKGEHDIFLINEALFCFGEAVLGSAA